MCENLNHIYNYSISGRNTITEVNWPAKSNSKSFTIKKQNIDSNYRESNGRMKSELKV